MTRGIRNKNPGNIERGQKWIGLAPVQSDPRFCVFTEARYGIRAIARLLRNYHSRYGLDTIAGIINRWAPPGENDSRAYVQSVCLSTKCGPGVKLDMTNPQTVGALVRAIIKHENGSMPYSEAEIKWGVAEGLKK